MSEIALSYCNVVLNFILAQLWVAPEHLREPGTLSQPGDVYSYAIIASEVVNRKPAWNYRERKESLDGEDLVLLRILKRLQKYSIWSRKAGRDHLDQVLRQPKQTLARLWYRIFRIILKTVLSYP